MYQPGWLDALFQMEDEKTAYTIQDSLCVEVSTNESAYNKNDIVEMTIRVQNSNEIKVKNISLEPVIPEGYKINNEENIKLTVKSLPVGKSTAVTVECVPDEHIEQNVIWIVCLGAALVGIILLILPKKEEPDERKTINLAIIHKRGTI